MSDDFNPYVSEEDSYDSRGKKMAGTAGLVLGIISIIICFIPVVGTIVAICGVIFSAIGLKVKSNNGKAIVGLVLSILALLISLILLLMTTFSFSTVLGSIDRAKRNNFDNSADVVADWIEEEYQKSMFGMASSEFITLCGKDGTDCENNIIMFRVTGGSDVLKASGVDYNSIDLFNSSLRIDSSGRACVILYGSEDGIFSDFTKEKLEKIGEEPAKSHSCN